MRRDSLADTQEEVSRHGNQVKGAAMQPIASPPSKISVIQKGRTITSTTITAVAMPGISFIKRSALSLGGR